MEQYDMKNKHNKQPASINDRSLEFLENFKQQFQNFTLQTLCTLSITKTFPSQPALPVVSVKSRNCCCMNA